MRKRMAFGSPGRSRSQHKSADSGRRSFALPSRRNGISYCLIRVLGAPHRAVLASSPCATVVSLSGSRSAFIESACHRSLHFASVTRLFPLPVKRDGYYWRALLAFHPVYRAYVTHSASLKATAFSRFFVRISFPFAHIECLVVHAEFLEFSSCALVAMPKATASQSASRSRESLSSGASFLSSSFMFLGLTAIVHAGRNTPYQRIVSDVAATSTDGPASSDGICGIGMLRMPEAYVVSD